MVTEGVFPRARPHGVLGSGVCLATVRVHFSFILNHNIDFFIMTSACSSFVGAQWTNLEAERSGDVCVAEATHSLPTLGSSQANDVLRL